MKTTIFPLMLDLVGRRVLLVGGGSLAARRAKDLVKAQAHVLLVAPQICATLRDLVDAGQVEWKEREFSSGDTEGAWLVQTATGLAEVDSAVAREAQASRIWCVVASDGGLSSAWTTAVVRGSDGVVIAVSGGYDPGRAQAIRDAIAEGVESGQLPIRPTRNNPRPAIGSVHLVGGGPGDSGLLTLRGRHLLSLADVVVVDRLAPREVLVELSEEVEIVDCAKSPGNHLMSQEEINTILIERARQGLRVVRLKGGDPFILGRGGEEALACQENGIPFEVVPGVTSATSVPAAAGIPLTHRGIAAAFTVLSGHEGLHPSVKDSEQTHVVLMGVEQIGHIVAAFINSGWLASTPVAVIERGWTSKQRTTIGTLSDIVEKAIEFNILSPAVIVIGKVVELHSQLGDLNGWQS